MTFPATSQTVIRPATDAFIIVDMQNDFLLDGASMHVPGGAALVDAINEVSRRFEFKHQTASQDWHPGDHCSFTQQGGPWPPHCVQGSTGAALHADLRTHHLHSIIHKGTSSSADSYSAFADETRQLTGLGGLLGALGVTRVFVCGVAYDYCVYFTAMDAREAGFEVVVVEDLCAAIDEELATTRTTALREAGAVVLRSTALVGVEVERRE